MKLEKEKLDAFSKEYDETNAKLETQVLETSTEILETMGKFSYFECINNKLFLDRFFATSPENYNEEQVAFLNFVKECRQSNLYEEIVENLLSYHRKNLMLFKPSLELIYKYVE